MQTVPPVVVPHATPSLLLQLESSFSSARDQDAQSHLHSIPTSLLLEWEQRSPILHDGLERIHWWRDQFASAHPITYERIHQSASRRANLIALVSSVTNKTTSNHWRFLLHASHARHAWQQEQQGGAAQVAINGTDEFGVDCIHIILHTPAPPRIQVLHLGTGERATLPLPSEALPAANEPDAMHVANAWTVPFQDAVILLLKSRSTPHHRELVWINTTAAAAPNDNASRDLSFWALNRNNMLEDPSAFMAPPLLHGDPTLTGAVLVSATEGRTDIAGARVAAAAVTIRHRDTLLFDQARGSAEATPKHWRHLLTAELWEPLAEVTASCFILDSMLLYACNDGILRAHPRGNPRSTYYVEDVRTRVDQMASLYNVVAMIHSVDGLEIRHVERRAADPFVSLSRVLYRAVNVDASHAPLLYGPHVIYRSLLEGAWVTATYDGQPTRPEPIKIPFRAGWTIESIRSANWRYWVATLRDPRTKLLEDYFLFAHTSDEARSLMPLLQGKCQACGQDASHFCTACARASFCMSECSEEARAHVASCRAGGME